MAILVQKLGGRKKLSSVSGYFKTNKKTLKQRNPTAIKLGGGEGALMALPLRKYFFAASLMLNNIYGFPKNLRKKQILNFF